MTSIGAGMHDRVFILEVSGPTLELIEEHLDRLPTFARFFREGATGRLTGPLQPTVAPSFSTLLTGQNPGRNGLYDSFRFPSGGYARLPYSARDLRHPTLFEHASRAGKRVGVLNVPLTYPLPTLNGFVVSGDEDAGDDYAWPAAVKAQLAHEGYVVPFGASYAPGREREFAQHVTSVLAMRRRALRTLFQDRQWELGMLTLYLYGELMHAFWRYYDRRHPDFRPPAEVF
ncbi:MAG TPA: alkaline phosphatase family protein, partial [Gemmatimonadaceae bacterium]|nr:alkaline phosphatase family protein [Gemmatimonadaceae bacterium]